MPCTADEAVRRAVMALTMGGQYILGTGDYHPEGDDVPWTENDGERGSDCAGFAICYCWKIVRHRPGFNHGSWASVEDDVNCNSALEDAQHLQALFTLPVDIPQPGDLIMYPTIHLSPMKTFVGHVGLVETVPEDYIAGEGWHRLGIIQCHGPNGFRPAVVRSDGSIWDNHDHIWPKSEHRTHLVRPKERVAA